MENIVFFNHANLGDVFLSRPFISQIMNSIDKNYSYAHCWGEYFLRDLNINYLPINVDPHFENRKFGNLDRNRKFYVIDDVVYINTWIGCYFDRQKPFYGECNLNSLYHLMYVKIFQFINSTFNTNIELTDILDYFPTIDYSFYHTENIDTYFQTNKNKTVLICNGPALSGQCEYNGNLAEIVIDLVKRYRDYQFITTQKLDIVSDNLIYTGEIIGLDGKDIIEISYLSQFCDIIIGRSSGPFTISNIRENIFNENKTFLCFGQRETDCLPYNLDIKCSFIFYKFDTILELNKTIEEILNDTPT